MRACEANLIHIGSPNIVIYSFNDKQASEMKTLPACMSSLYWYSSYMLILISKGGQLNSTLDTKHFTKWSKYSKYNKNHKK